MANPLSSPPGVQAWSSGYWPDRKRLVGDGEDKINKYLLLPLSLPLILRLYINKFRIADNSWQVAGDKVTVKQAKRSPSSTPHCY